MKDYSLNSEERKDFILGYEPIGDGNIAVKFAEGEPKPIPHTDKNEQIVIDKMKSQVANSSKFESKMIQKKKNYYSYFLSIICAFVISLNLGLEGYLEGYVTETILVASIIASCSIIPGTLYIRTKLKLKDLEKNKKFLAIEKKLNDNVRNINQNVLVNVSKKTKDYVSESLEDNQVNPVFNINSFNYVPFKDLEQIIENVDSNERFGFEYDTEDNVLTRKKTRKM